MHARSSMLWLIGSVVLLLTGCRLQLIVETGGRVQSASTIYDCTESASPCLSELPTGAFEEIFTAVPDEDFRFAGWDGWCWGSLKVDCALSLTPEIVALDLELAITARFNPVIVGTWFLDSPSVTDGLVSLTFYESGAYVMTGPCETAFAVNPAGTFEMGTFTFSPTTGAFSNTAVIGSIPGCGTRDLVNQPILDTIAITGDNMELRLDGETAMTLTRLEPRTSDRLTGTWYVGDPLAPGEGFAQVTFFDGDTYLIAEQCEEDALPPGLEYGIYSWDSQTRAFSTQPPILDTMGACGFYEPDEPEARISSITPGSTQLIARDGLGERILLDGVFY